MDSMKNNSVDWKKPEVELTDEMLERNDELYNAIQDCANIFAEKKIEWDMSIIGPVADFLCSILHEHGYPVRYPSIVTDNEQQYIEEYYSP